MVLFYIFPFMRVVNKSLVHTVTELAIALGVAPATAYRAVIPRRDASSRSTLARTRRITSSGIPPSSVPTRSSISRSSASSNLIERGSPAMALLTSCLISASRLVILLRLPFSLMTTGSLSTFSINVARFFAPLGRPLGFPDCPLQKRVRRGGLPNPTAYSGLSSSAILHLRLGFELAEASAACTVACALAGVGLPATDDSVDIERVELEPVAAPAGAFGRDYGGAAAEKAVKYDIAARRRVHDRIRHQCSGFDGGMQCKQIAFLSGPRERAGARVLPHICPVAPELAKLDVVSMRGAAVFEDEYEFMA